jgi:hypothetical protein
MYCPRPCNTATQILKVFLKKQLSVFWDTSSTQHVENFALPNIRYSDFLPLFVLLCDLQWHRVSEGLVEESSVKWSEELHHGQEASKLHC